MAVPKLQFPESDSCFAVLIQGAEDFNSLLMGLTLGVARREQVRQCRTEGQSSSCQDTDHLRRRRTPT
jgi:hypothetical protein